MARKTARDEYGLTEESITSDTKLSSNASFELHTGGKSSTEASGPHTLERREARGIVMPGLRRNISSKFPSLAERVYTPIIFITAMGALQDKVTGLECGADDYLVKPFDVEELLARIHSILRRPVKWESSFQFKIRKIAFPGLCFRKRDAD